MYSRVEVDEYRVLRGIDCRLAPLTLFVGPNGCGKSTLLEIVGALAQVGNPWPSPGDGVRLEPWSGGRVSAELWSASKSVRVAPKHTAPELRESDQRLAAWPPDRHMLVLSLQLLTPELRRPSPFDAPPRLASNGSGLAAVFADMKLRDDPRLDAILAGLRAVVPQVEGLTVQRSPEGREYALFLRFATGAFPATAVSEGTLHVLALLTALAQAEDHPALLLIDDLDRGLHPLAQRDLAQKLQALLAARPDKLQILATTHSPYLLDHVPPESVRMMALGDDGYARLAQLSDHEQYEAWKSVMAPGELWSAIGERWVVERPR